MVPIYKGGYTLNKVKGYRVMLGKTQKDMGEIFGISRQSYYQKERGKVPFSDKEKIIFKKLVQTVIPNINIDEIFFGEELGNDSCH